MATITPIQSSLASELLLNKLMNGQVQSSTGKTITAAGRAISSALSGQAYAANVAEANMVNGAGMVSTAQSQLTDVKDQLDNLKKNMLALSNNGSASATMFTDMGATAKTLLGSLQSSIKGASYNNTSLFTATAIKLSAGDGMTIDVLGKAMTTGLKAALGNVGATITGKTTLETAISSVDDAINEMIQQISNYSFSLKEVQNRAIVLAEKGDTLNNAASAQAIAGVSGANGLLNSILGGNTTV